MAPWLLAAVLLSAAPGDAERTWLLEPKGRLRLATGGEWDTNAERGVDGEEGAESTSGALLRLLIEADGQLRWTAQDHLQVRYVLGAKRFFEQSAEDLLVQDLSAYSRHRLGRWFSGRVSGRWRQSRIRSGRRDYDLGLGGAALSLFPGAGFTVELRGSYSAFEFSPEPDFDNAGPTLGGELTWAPTSKLSFSAHLDHGWLGFSGNAFVLGREVRSDGSILSRPTLCATPQEQMLLSCRPLGRDDTELSVGGRAAYRGGFVLGGEALVRMQRSSSLLENIDRFRVSLFATFKLPLSLVFNVLGSVQINKGVSVTASRNLAEDDENQNSLKVQLSRQLIDELSVELGYALFASAFATASASFLRQTGYLGLSVQLDSRSP